MTQPTSSSNRISCPQCGGKVKLPPYQAGQRCHCPRCGAEMVASAPSPPSDRSAPVNTSAPAAATIPSVPPSAPASPAAPAPANRRVNYDDVYGITCQVCQTRLHVRPLQAGTTIQCPDCHSSVLVTPPPKRKLPNQAARPAPPNAEGSGTGPSAMQTAAQKLLDKARAEQEKAEADEREQSPDRFVQGFFDFLCDPRAIVRLVILAVWFALAMALLQRMLAMRIAEQTPALLAEAASLIGALVLATLLLTFLIAAAACAWALVSGTSEGQRRIESWPGFNVLAWDRRFGHLASAAFAAALPGVLVGFALGLLGITGTMVYTAAATFGAFFPPMLWSMYENNSALMPFDKEAWESIYQRPDPWKLTYLITSILIIASLFGGVTSLVHGFPLGSAGAMLLVASMTLYFRTVGRLFCYLAGRDVSSHST